MVHFSKVAFIGSVAAMLFASVAADDDSYTIVQDCGAGFGSCPSNKPCCSRGYPYAVL